MRKLVLVGLSAFALSLSGCGQPADETSPTPAATIDSAPENAPGITVTDAVVRLPAAPGRPGVAYFTVSQGSGAPRSIAAAYIEGVERAEMHETVAEGSVSKMQPVKAVPIESGKSVQFKAGGLHVMLFDVADTLKAGGTTEITLTLDNGDKVSAPARIEAIGGGMSGEMDHGSMDHSGHDMSEM
jgi:hypothetical protein